MKSILIMCYADPQGCPRPNRMISALKDDYDVTVVGRGDFAVEGVKKVKIPPTRRLSLAEKVKYGANLKLCRFEQILWSDRMRQLREEIGSREYDLIVCHDLYLLPLALSVKKGGKVFFDAREYYPRHFEDRFAWRLFYQDFNRYLCSRYLPQCDRMITVSEGIAAEYARSYGVRGEVVMSLPDFFDLEPGEVSPDKIRIVYHGNACPSRRTDRMMEMMDHVDQRFTLDLMLMPNDPGYLEKLSRMAADRSNVKIIPPVPYPDIIPFINRYDIGLFLVPQTTFNLEFTLPNKFFEFIQARLAVAIGPSTEMKRVVEAWGCGVVSRTFEPESMAEEINRLTPRHVMQHKRHSEKAAEVLNHEENRKKLLLMIEGMLQE